MTGWAIRRPGQLWVLAIVLTGACSGEEPVPVDLRATSTTLDADDPNAAERQRMEDLARQQCLEDPEREEGVVRLVDPETDQVISEIVVPCEDLRDP